MSELCSYTIQTGIELPMRAIDFDAYSREYFVFVPYVTKAWLRTESTVEIVYNDEHQDQVEFARYNRFSL